MESNVGSLPRRRYDSSKRRRQQDEPPPELPIDVRKKQKVKDIIRRGAEAARDEKCCGAHCFRSVGDVEFLLEKRKELLSPTKTRAARKLYALEVYDKKTRRFVFDGVPVCFRFMIAAFNYSNDTLCGVAGTPGARSTATVAPLPRLTGAPKQTSIVHFLRQIAETQGDHMPDRVETHLTYRRPQQVYEILKDSWMQWAPPGQTTERIVSFSYFVRVWKSECPHIKTRKTHRFSLCDLCETLKDAIEKCGTNMIASKPHRDMLMSHYTSIRKARDVYRESQTRAAQFPGEYCSIIVDGANQEAFSLPHFHHKMKAESTGYSIEMGLIGLIEHLPGQVRSVRLFTMAEDMETGSNHVIEVIHRWLQEKEERGVLPSRLLVQLDNCSRENKNRYLLAYFETLVAYGVFMEVRASFLPKGHTHEDIDQVFSRTAEALRPVDAITLNDLHTILRGAYTPRPTVSHVSNVANIRDALRKDEVLLPINGLAITQYHFFIFSRRAGSDEQSRIDAGAKYYLTTCSVKGTVLDPGFQPLRGEGARHAGQGFLRNPPDLHAVPNTHTKALGAQVRTEVTKRLNAVETRIDNASKLAELRRLRDEVYCDDKRCLVYAWPEDCVERKMQNLTLLERSNINAADDKSDEEDDGELEAQENENEYEVGTFAAIKPDAGSTDPFWIAKIESVVVGSTGRPQQLKVSWYQSHNMKRYYDSRFSACGRKGSVVTDTIYVQAVLVSFDDLNGNGTVPAEARKQIRLALDDVQ